MDTFREADQSNKTATFVVTCPFCGQRGKLFLTGGKSGSISLQCHNCGHTFVHMLEKRSDPRKTPLPRARFGIFDPHFRDLSLDAEILDISMSGLRVRTNENFLPQGERLCLVFRLPSGPSELRVGAEVMWKSETSEGYQEMGVRFFYVSEDDRKRIGFYLEA